MRPLTAEEEDSPLMDLREHRETATSNKHALMDLKLYLETPMEGGYVCCSCRFFVSESSVLSVDLLFHSFTVVPVMVL